MSRIEDDDADATTWAGDSDPSLVASSVSPALREDEPDEATTVPKEGMPSALLVTYGVLAGVYLLYTVGWLLGLQRLTASRIPSADVLSEAMTQLGFVLAIAGPVLWFGASFLLTRGSKPLVRLLWVAAGVIVVLPWPFVLGAWL